jgi:hypothetical protein
MLNGLGIHTGVNLDAVADASRHVAPLLGHGLASRYVQALDSGHSALGTGH